MAEIKGEGQGPFGKVIGRTEKTVVFQDASGKIGVTALGEGPEFKPGEELGAGRRVKDYNPETRVYEIYEADGTITQTIKPRG